MKIIFCICLLSVTVCRSYGQSEQLSAIVQGKVTFPAAVKKNGQLVYEGDAIADVTNGQSTGLKTRFSDRVEWNSRTGFFSISDLEADDSGVYEVQFDGGKKTYALTLYKDNVPVAKPNVNVTGDEYPCTLLCTVERGTEATLSWYREGEEKPFVISRVRSAPHLDLPQTVDKVGIYTCQAKNSVSNETSDPITVGSHCTDGAAAIWQTRGSLMWNLCLVLIVTLYSFLL